MYEDKTPEAIKAAILAAIRQSQGLSAMAGGFADGVAGPVAEQLSEAYRALEGVTSMLFVDESSGGYIDLVGGQYYNITRREGTRAYCDISFSGTPGLVIPKGTAFLTAGGLSYALMAAVALGPEGTGRGRLEAAEAGSAYNVEAGAIDRMYVNLTGLTDYHSEAAAGGTDAESDAALLARVRERVQRPPTSGNGYQYRQWAMEVAGVGSAKVVELPGGPGTVGVTLVDSNDRAPSEEIVEAVTAHIEEERPIGAAVTVTAAGEREVTVAAQVSLTGGAGAGAVQDAFRAALAGYLHTLIEGKYGAVYYKPADDQPYTLLYNRVLALLLNVEGGSHEELERCFSLTRMVLEALEKRGFSCSFLTNAATAGAIGQWNQVSDGLGSGHTRTILEGLGRATYDVREPFSSLVNRAVRGARDGQAHILITPAPLQRSDAFLAPLFQQSQGRLFIINAREDGMGSQEVSG